MFERATREWSTSPTIQMFAPSSDAEAAAQREDVEQRLGRVLVLAVAGVDRPPPASSRRPAAPRPRAASGSRSPPGRRPRASARCPCSDSPLSTLEPAERTLTTSAERRLAASSKLELVRVRGLVEEVDDGPPAQRRDLLDLAGRRPRRTTRRGRGSARSRRGRGPRSRSGGGSWCGTHAALILARWRGRSSPRRRRRSRRRGR